MADDLRNIRSIEEIRMLRLWDFPQVLIMPEEFEHIFGLFDAFWKYPGEPNPDRPHALLKSGDHSDGFINCSEVLKESNLCEYFARELLRRIREVYNGPINWAIGAAYAGIDLTHEVARQVQGEACRHAFVEKDKEGNPTVWTRFTITEGEHVLIVNELMTTASGSTYETKVAVQGPEPKESKVIFVPFAAVMVNRSRDAEKLADGTQVISVVRYKMTNFNPNECPYCAAGSPALKPKVEGNWKRYFSS